MKNFNWENFKNGKIAVHCDTEEKAKDFLKECEKQGMKWVCGDKATHHTRYKRYKEKTAYKKDFYGIRYCDYEIYKERGTKIIKWEIETMEELTFKEVIANIKEREVWESDLKIITRGKTDITISFKQQTNFCSMNFDDDTLYRLQRKKYTFQEALKAYEEGKEIESKVSTHRYKKIDGRDMYFNVIFEEFKNAQEVDFNLKEIRGAWYIND